jgi:adenosylhomocysteine nucleosidase
MTTIRSVGVVVALASEAHALTVSKVHPHRITPLANDADLYLSGMGPVAARMAAQALIDAGAKALMVFGVAGALDADLRNGTLFCPEHVLDENGHDYATDAVWRSRLMQQLSRTSLPLLRKGALVSVPMPLMTMTAKRTAHMRYAAQAVDMESAAVAAIARASGLPFVCLRAIVDEMQDTIPAPLHASVDAWGRPRLVSLLATLGRHPSVLTDLPNLYFRMRRATRALHAATDAIDTNFGWRS